MNIKPHDEFKYVIDFVNDKNKKQLVMKSHPRRSGKTTILVDTAIRLSITDNIIFTVPKKIMVDYIFEIFKIRDIHNGTKYNKKLNIIIFQNGNYVLFKTPQSNLRGIKLGVCSFISYECFENPKLYSYFASDINKIIIN